jgi:hypothetical protein
VAIPMLGMARRWLSPHQSPGSQFHLLLNCLLIFTFQFVTALSLLAHSKANGSRCIENSTSSTKPKKKQPVSYAPRPCGRI